MLFLFLFRQQLLLYFFSEILSPPPHRARIDGRSALAPACPSGTPLPDLRTADRRGDRVRGGGAGRSVGQRCLTRSRRSAAAADPARLLELAKGGWKSQPAEFDVVLPVEGELPGELRGTWFKVRAFRSSDVPPRGWEPREQC